MGVALTVKHATIPVKLRGGMKMSVSNRLPIVISIFLLFASPSTAGGQTDRFFCSGRRWQMGPVEQSLYSPQHFDVLRRPSAFLCLYPDTSRIRQAHPYALIGGGLVGASAGVLTAVLIGSAIRTDYTDTNDAVPFFTHGMRVGLLTAIVLEPLGMTAGIHLVNRGRGEFGRVVGSAYGSLLLGSAVVIGFAQTGIGRNSPGFLWTLSLAIPLYQLYRTIRQELRTARSAVDRDRIQPLLDKSVSVSCHVTGVGTESDAAPGRPGAATTQ